MQYGIAFAPLVPSLVLWIAIAAIVAIAGLLLLGRARGARGAGFGVDIGRDIDRAAACAGRHQ